MLRSMGVGIIIVQGADREKDVAFVTLPALQDNEQDIFPPLNPEFSDCEQHVLQLQTLDDRYRGHLYLVKYS